MPANLAFEPTDPGGDSLFSTIYTALAVHEERTGQPLPVNGLAHDIFEAIGILAAEQLAEHLA